MPKPRRAHDTHWTTFSAAVHGFGWTGRAAWERFRTVGLLDRSGAPHPELLQHGVARRIAKRWEWNKPLLESLLEHMGIERMPPLEHAAWHAVQEFRLNIARARRMTAKGAGRSQVQAAELAAAVGLLAAKPAAGDPLEAEKFQALSVALYRAGYGDAFQEQLLSTMHADAARVMAHARQQLMQPLEEKPLAARRVRRL